MIIDCQHHAMPRSVFKKFHDPSLPPKRVFMNNNDFVFNPRLCLIEEHLEAMDEAGVNMAVLSISQFANLMGKELCREINEGFAEIMVKYPGRFVIAGCFPQDDPEAAAEEIKYQVKTLGFPAVTMLTSLSEEITLNNEEYMVPVYETAKELGIPLFMHPHLKPFGMEPDFTISRTVGRGVDSAKAVLRLLYGILPKYPDLKFILPHFGGATFALKGRMRNFFEPWPELNLPPRDPKYANIACTPVELEENGYGAAFDEWFDKLYFDGAGSAGWPVIAETAFKAARSDRLVFGSDYPYEVHEGRDFKWYLEQLDTIGLTKEQKDAFLGGNAEKLLKL